tara:strand:+ start:5152 stop:5499 length:348 start_codon:yes stop_codon:yes gene_type:complete
MKRLEEIVDHARLDKQGRWAVFAPQGESLLLYAGRILKLKDEALATRNASACGMIWCPTGDPTRLHISIGLKVRALPLPVTNSNLAQTARSNRPPKGSKGIEPFHVSVTFGTSGK